MILLGEVVNNEYQISYLKLISMCFAISMSFLFWGSSKFLPIKAPKSEPNRQNTQFSKETA